MRYNTETDTVEIYYNGEWHEWKSGNMQTVYLYKDGEQVVALDATGSYSYSSAIPARGVGTLKEDYIEFAYPSAANGYHHIGLMEQYDFTGYTTVYFEVDYGGATHIWELPTNNCGYAYLSFAVYYAGSAFSIMGCLSSTKATCATNKYSTKGFVNGSSCILRKIWVE